MSDAFEDIVHEAVRDRARDQGFDGLSQIAVAYLDAMTLALSEGPSTRVGRALLKLAISWVNDQHATANSWDAAWETGDSAPAFAHEARSIESMDRYLQAMEDYVDEVDSDVEIIARWARAAELDLLRSKFLALAFVGKTR